MKPTFKECKHIADALGFQLIKNNKGYTVHKYESQPEKRQSGKSFPTLMDFVGWALYQERKK
jgi:hypothetical protein